MIPSLNMFCTACNPTSLMSAKFHCVHLYSIVGTVSEDINLFSSIWLLGCILNPLCLFLNCLLGSNFIDKCEIVYSFQHIYVFSR